MPKGFFMQGLVVLLRQDVALAELRDRLSGYKVVKEVPAGPDWTFGGPALVVEYRPQVNGFVSIDVVPRRWPDHMGDPQRETTLFGAWTTGHFGPYTFPGGLERAAQQSWRWDGAQEAVAGHQAFLRIRLSYIFGASKDAPVMPKDGNPLDELRFLTGLAREILAHPAALCYFNPNGEVLLPHQELGESADFSAAHDLPPLDLWSNIRLFQVSDTWSLMDCVGNWQ